MAKPAARVTDPTSCPMPGHGPQSIAYGSPACATGVVLTGSGITTKGAATTFDAELEKLIHWY